ncbi:MAG: hypothetical protein JSS77_16160 [Acidobacteria bacterium]|nr:hypothetical protein [Acidobacteriota bacterium]
MTPTIHPGTHPKCSISGCGRPLVYTRHENLFCRDFGGNWHCPVHPKTTPAPPEPDPHARCYDVIEVVLIAALAFMLGYVVRGPNRPPAQGTTHSLSD